jgi:hypothetical protein
VAPSVSGDRRVIAFDYLKRSDEIKTRAAGLVYDATDRLRHRGESARRIRHYATVGEVSVKRSRGAELTIGG